MKKRVLHVAECAGGVDRYLRSLFKYSTCENIAILSQLYTEEDYVNLVDHLEIMNMSHGIGVNAFKEALKLRQKIKQFNPDVVYAHSSIAGAITRMACIGLKVLVIYNPHGWSFNMDSGKKKIYIALEKIMSYFCDAIVCISEAEKVSACREKICNKNKLHVIYNGIDIDSYTKEEVQLSIPENAFVVGMVGRICRQKAPDIFVKMAGKVQQEIPNAYFIIVGDVMEGAVSEKQKIEQLAKKLNVNLLITGWVNNPFAYINKFDVGCLLSRWEGFGLVIPEYMLTRTPVVATKVDAIPYLIKDGENGILVEMDDWEAAANAVLKLYYNKDIRNKVIAQGMKDVYEKFDVRRVAMQTDNLINTLVRGD